jgi:hypothetical protein
MELAKRTESVEEPLHFRTSPVAPAENIGDSVLDDHDVVLAWQLKAQLCWVRNDQGPVNGFRWILWDRFGLGNPPSRVDQRSTRCQPEAEGDRTTSTLRLVR